MYSISWSLHTLFGTTASVQQRAPAEPYGLTGDGLECYEIQDVAASQRSQELGEIQMTGKSLPVFVYVEQSACCFCTMVRVHSYPSSSFGGIHDRQ